MKINHPNANAEVSLLIAELEATAQALINAGWTEVRYVNRYDNDNTISNWITETLTGKHQQIGFYHYFEKEADATMFILRWS